MTKTNINTIIAIYCDSLRTNEKAVADAKATAKRDGIPFLRPALTQYLIQGFAAKHGAKLVEKKKGEGLTWVTDDAGNRNTKGDTAYHDMSSMINRIMGGTKAEKADQVIPADVLKAARAFLKLCGEYDVKSVSAFAKKAIDKAA